MADLPTPQPPAPPEDQAAPQAPEPPDLPEELQNALLLLVGKFEAENRDARVEEVRKIQKRREFFRKNQQIYWDNSDRRWHTIGSNGLNTTNDDEELPRYDYVENVYRAHCKIFQSVVSQNPSHCAFAPQDPESADDIATAKAADDVATFVSDNNKLDQAQARVAWYLWNDGVCASYTHFEKDADKYGVMVVPKFDLVPTQITPDALVCPQCGYEEEIPQGDPSLMGAAPTDCPQCGAPMGPETLRPGQVAPVAQHVGDEEYPKGQERILYLGGLEVVRPYYAKDLEGCPWISWECEVHKSWVKSVYPKTLGNLDQKIGVGGDSSAENARSARVSLMSTSYGRSMTDSSGSLIPLRRYWIRPWAFAHLDDAAVAQKLVAQFPDGAYVVFAGTTYCESSSDRLDKRWAICFADEGDGMIRDGLGEDLTDIQERLNTEENIFTETIERGIGTRFFDTNTVDSDSYLDAGALVGLDIPCELAPGEKMNDKIYDAQPMQVSAQQPGHTMALRGPVPEFITGMSPSLYGGDTGENHTATGISITKDSALGRVALIKRAMNEFYAETMLNAIDCFKENRTEDVQMAVLGAAGELDSKIIRLEDLRGNCYARTQADESYPVSVIQKRQLVMDLIGSPNSQVQAALTSPQNFDVLKSILGMQDLEIPGEDARRKQLREIRRILDGEQVQVDALLDNHDVEMAAISEWWSSDEGQQYAGTPQAEQIRQHMMAHLEGKAAQAQIVANPMAATGQQPAGPAQSMQPQPQAGPDMASQGQPPADTSAQQVQ